MAVLAAHCSTVRAAGPIKAQRGLITLISLSSRAQPVTGKASVSVIADRAPARRARAKRGRSAASRAIHGRASRYTRLFRKTDRNTQKGDSRPVRGNKLARRSSPDQPCSNH